MKRVVGSILMLVLFIYLILIFNNYSVDYDKSEVEVNFIAVENIDTEEVLYTHRLIYEITDIHIDGVFRNVNDVIVSINVVEEGSITLVDNVTRSGDEIFIVYSYKTYPSLYTVTFIDVIPIIMVVILIGGIAYLIIRRS